MITKTKSYKAPDFTISPDYCVFTTSVSVSDFTPSTLPKAVGTTLAAGPKNLIFGFSYSQDLKPLTQTTTTTVTATAKTTKNAFSLDLPKTATLSDSFKTTYQNPCLKSSDGAKLDVVTQDKTSYTDNYSGVGGSFVYKQYSMTPSICPLTVECNSITKDGKAQTHPSNT